MSKPTRTKRVSTIKRAESSKPKTVVKPAKLTATKKKPLTVADATSAIRFGSVGENSMIYLKEGVDKLVDDLQIDIATKEAAKKTALSAVEGLLELPVTSTMSEIRERLNTVVVSLQNVFAAL